MKTRVSKATVNPQVSARDKHAIYVEPIVPRLKNNKDAHLDYLRHLKESIETIRDIVEEAKVWVPIGKRNCYLDLEKSQSNPIYKIAVDLLKNTNFFRAFTASSTIPSIYVQQFWDTILYDKKAGCYRCQLDEKWFVLTKETLREALQITPVNNNQAFAAPLSIDGLIDFVNQLGYPKPRAPALQILWGVVTRTNIDYAKRIWEEFTQSIHTFIEDKRNLSRHTSGKKRVTLILIPSIWFTKLVIHHLQRRHRFYPRPDSPLHLPNEEPVLGYLKFSAKGTKREVFRMPIPGSLITTEIQQASYYREYLAKVDQHRRYLAGETGGVQDPPAPKPTQPARKPKTTAPKAPSRPSVSIPASKTKEVPTVEPHVADEDADYQKVLEESMKDAYALPRGTLPPVVIREPESGKYQPLPEVSGKGKAKMTEEQVAHDLLSLQKHKKISPMDQYIFQRRVSEPTGSSRHDESPYALLGQSDSEEESEKVVLEAEEGGQDEGQAGPDPDAQAEDQTGSNAGAQAKDQTGSDVGAQAEGQAGSNPDETSEGQAKPNPGDAEAKVQSITSLVVHAGSDREHMDLDVADVSPQPSTEQLDEGFTATAYPKVQENLKLAIEEHVLLEEPASSSRTLSSMQHLSRDFSFGDQFFSDKPSKADKNTSPIIDLSSRPESPTTHQQFKATTTDIKTTTTLPPQTPQQSKTEAMMVKRIGELEHIMANLIQVNKDMEERLDSHGSRLYTLEQLDIPQQVSIAVSEVVTDAVDWAMQAPLRNRFRDLPEADMKEILHQRMWESESYKSHEDHMQLFEALEKSMNRDHSEELTQDLAEARKKKASGSAQVAPSPPPPSSTNQEIPSKGSAAPSPSKTATSAEYQAWTTTDIRLKPSISLTPADLEMDEDMALDEKAQSSDDEDIRSAHIPAVNLRQGWWKPFEEEQPATPEPAWSICSSDMLVPTNNWASALTSNYSPPPEDSLLAQTSDIATFMAGFARDEELLSLNLKTWNDLLMKSLNVDDPILRHNVSKPLPLGGPPSQVTIQSDFFFNKDLEYLRYGNKGRRPALSISKMKAAYYPDAGLEQMVPDHAVRTYMRIVSVVRIEVFSMYEYDYMKKIVLRRADLNEYVIAKRDFKYLYPSDFKDLYLLNLQGHLNHLPPKDKKILTTAVNLWTRQLVIRQRVEDFQLEIESYQTQLNLTKPQWDATGYEYKHDYIVIDSTRAAIFRDKYGVQMMMHVNEIHKFSDDTLQQIDEALDYRIKEFRINRMNPGLNTRFWARKDVDRSKAFMFAIQRRLKTRRIFRNLESFVGGRVREGDYRL
nr:monodehydroascorbate reductase [Tanacetum cinerariifolium]